MGKLLRKILLFGIYNSEKIQIWGIGKFATSEYKKEFKKNSRFFINLPYYSDLSRFQNNQLFEKIDIDINLNKINIIYSGSLIRRKGVDDLALAFLGSAKRNRNLHLTLMGLGDLKAEMLEILREVSERVKFIGFIDWDDLPNQYLSSHILCVPSKYDGWNLVVPEGLASGLPVITSDMVGAAHDLITQDENGWIFKAGDVHALEECFNKVALLSPRKFIRMTKAAREAVSNHSLDSGAKFFISSCAQAIELW